MHSDKMGDATLRGSADVYRPQDIRAKVTVGQVLWFDDA